MQFSSLRLTRSILGAASIGLFGSAKNGGNTEVEMIQLPGSDLFLSMHFPALLSLCKTSSPTSWPVDGAREAYPSVPVGRYKPDTLQKKKKSNQLHENRAN